MALHLRARQGASPRWQVDDPSRCLQPFIVTAEGRSPDSTTTDVTYDGDLNIESHSILLSLRSTGDPLETLIFRFRSGVTFTTQTIAGIWMCFDYDTHTAAGFTIVSRRE
jgi:hypothetical protein